MQHLALPQRLAERLCSCPAVGAAVSVRLSVCLRLTRPSCKNLLAFKPTCNTACGPCWIIQRCKKLCCCRVNEVRRHRHNVSLLNWLLSYCHCKKGSLQLHFQPSTNHSAVSIFWHWMFTVAPEAISLLCMCDTYCRTDSKATVDLEYWRVFTVLKWHRTTFLLKITVLFHFLFLLLTQSTSLTWYRTVPLMPGCPQCSVNKCWPRLLLGYNYFEPDQFVSALCFHFFRELSHLKHLHWQHDISFLNPPNWSWHINIMWTVSIE